MASGTNIGPSASDTSSSGIRVNKSYPTFAKLSVPSNSLTNGTTEANKTLYRFSVMASGGDLAIYKLSFSISSSSEVATTTSFGLYAYTDSGFSLVDSAFTSDGLINYANCIGGNN